MALRLTHENLPAAYEFLRACQPFHRWNLPEADAVEFKVTRDRDCWGYMHGDVRSPDAAIGISEIRVGSAATLLQVMAHEMIHLRQHVRRTETSNTQHNAEFMRLARLVCKHHCFDLKAFV
jgi:hypothetical protein